MRISGIARCCSIVVCGALLQGCAGTQARQSDATMNDMLGQENLDLLFATDRSGYWNVHRYDGRSARALTDLRADVGQRVTAVVAAGEAALKLQLGIPGRIPGAVRRRAGGGDRGRRSAPALVRHPHQRGAADRPRHRPLRPRCATAVVGPSPPAPLPQAGEG